MAQTLKKDKEELILSKSKDLFLHFGYDNTSMKDVAKATNISVGNLYHYYKNKGDIALNIVRPLLEKIDIFIKKYTNEDVSIFSLEFHFTAKDIIKPKEINKVIMELIKYLVDLYDEYENEFIIINTCSDIINYLKKWLSALIIYFIEKKYKISNLFNDEISALVPSYTDAIIGGAINIFINKKINIKKKKKILGIYFGSYASMLDIKNIIVRG